MKGFAILLNVLLLAGCELFSSREPTLSVPTEVSLSIAAEQYAIGDTVRIRIQNQTRFPFMFAHCCRFVAVEVQRHRGTTWESLVHGVHTPCGAFCGSRPDSLRRDAVYETLLVLNRLHHEPGQYRLAVTYWSSHPAWRAQDTDDPSVARGTSKAYSTIFMVH